jgi:hypothetical protein
MTLSLSVLAVYLLYNLRKYKELEPFIPLSAFMQYIYLSALQSFAIIMQYGRFPIMQAAAHERHEIVEILLPHTNPIPSLLPDWSVGGIISTMKTLPRVC